MVAFNPERDITDLSGKVILVTGGNNGLGKETIIQLAKHNPSKIYMASRSEERANTAIAEITKTVPRANIIFLPLDLASLASVRKAADIFLSSNNQLDILVNNAGVMTTEPGLTKDGYEVNFGTNHMGPALLTKLLLPVLQSTRAGGSDVRIVNLSSALYQAAPKPGILFAQNKTPLADLSTLARYGQSKLANAYFTTSFAKRYPKIKSVAIHPGVVRTSLTDVTKGSSFFLSLLVRVSNLMSVTIEEGAWNQLWASTASSVVNGAFYFPVGKETHAKVLDDKKQAEALWEWTEAELKAHGY
ncbi:Short-chain dehydrogenase/reductase SDR [Penicillium expansum]|uniref:Short-chain dehydrogenase/reductase SDR n=1 Tax=Penicillium expansum TaxID=27334 RepID=A0A0A2JQV4_PENEN|nr:Short-chain dehydrogenase/reductase SDR [Penicillium expansum]KGO57181.1 Short-chain dehydrogenase/reductase SDR [Penicillium expansum]